MKKYIFSFIIITATASVSKAQVNDEQLGAWYMYFYSTSFKNSSWGIQGDAQFRNWNILGDLEQLLLRSGLTYTPKNADIKFTLGYANITTGDFGTSSAVVSENRIYQEALFPVKFGNRFYTNHRFRYEQRFVEDQDLRTRYRYNLFLNIPINQETLDKGAVYLALYNELFINGQKKIGDQRTVELYDRNRFYAAMGYSLMSGLRLQFGLMNQKRTTGANTNCSLAPITHFDCFFNKYLLIYRL